MTLKKEKIFNLVTYFNSVENSIKTEFWETICFEHKNVYLQNNTQIIVEFAEWLANRPELNQSKNNSKFCKLKKKKISQFLTVKNECVTEKFSLLIIYFSKPAGLWIVCRAEQRR